MAEQALDATDIVIAYILRAEGVGTCVAIPACLQTKYVHRPIQVREIGGAYVDHDGVRYQWDRDSTAQNLYYLVIGAICSGGAPSHITYGMVANADWRLVAEAVIAAYEDRYPERALD
jgi:hypothetical protein